MTGRTRAADRNPKPEDILVAVDAHLDHGENVSALFTLFPETIARAAPEVREAGVDRRRKRFRVHPGEHQDFAGACVRHDGGYEALAIELWLKVKTLLDYGGGPA
jgi:hypothetical protein